MPRKYKKKTTQQYKPADSPPSDFVPGFLQSLDKRTNIAKALQDRFDAIVLDLGGAERLSTIKLGLIEQYVFLTYTIYQTNEDYLNAKDAKERADIAGKYFQSVNTINGLSKTLGIDRERIKAPWAQPLIIEPENTLS